VVDHTQQAVQAAEQSDLVQTQRPAYKNVAAGQVRVSQRSRARIELASSSSIDDDARSPQFEQHGSSTNQCSEHGSRDLKDEPA
jgi:hypothetical protein